MEYSPFHINAKIKKYRKKSNFRKPGNLMIEKLIKKWGINRRKAFMVGDNKKDYLAAKKVNYILNMLKEVCLSR